MSHKISVIIPVYNTGKYLSQCLDSVCGQTFKNIEIICVDDCSTDNSKSILMQYATKDERIKIISFQENQGVSAARNAGIQIAQGKYMYFMDSDDWLDNDYLENMHTVMEKYSVDAVFNMGICFEYDGGITRIVDRSRPLKLSCGLVNSIDLLNWSDNYYGSAWIGSAWVCLFRTEIIKNKGILFPKLYLGEDTYFVHLYLNNVSKVFVINSSRYHYRQYSSSSYHKVSDRISMRICLYNALFDVYESNDWIKKNIEFINLVACADEPMTINGYKGLSDFIARRGSVIRKIYRFHHNPYEWIIDAFEEKLSYEEFSKKYLSHGSKNLLKNHYIDELRQRIKNFKAK